MYGKGAEMDEIRESPTIDVSIDISWPNGNIAFKSKYQSEPPSSAVVSSNNPGFRELYVPFLLLAKIMDWDTAGLI